MNTLTEQLTKQLDAKKYVILIVDDTPTNLGVIVDYLENYGFDIMVARNGESGLTRAKLAPPDIILLDVMMPGIDGFETCRQLKADESTKNIPVIFMTALTGVDDKVKGFAVGGVDYVTKPLQQEEVLARVNTHLQIRDLTRQLQFANDELQQANQALTQLNADKDKFFSIVAHDLRNPFVPLLGNAQLLEQMADHLSPTEIKKMSGAVYRGAKRVSDLLESLLHWSRLQMGRMEYHPNRLALRMIVQHNLELLQDNAVQKNITLTYDFDDDIFVYTDKSMLDTVIRNLISNALKFTPTGGRVTVLAEEKCAKTAEDSTPAIWVEIAVTDTGVGIAQADRNKLFKFGVHHTTPGTDKEKGAGLGLVICQEMVQYNGGKIWVESEVGQGTTVKFTVPGVELDM